MESVGQHFVVSPSKLSTYHLFDHWPAELNDTFIFRVPQENVVITGQKRGRLAAVFDEGDVVKARDQLIAAGIADSDPRLNIYSELQAIRNFAAEGSSEVRAAY